MALRVAALQRRVRQGAWDEVAHLVREQRGPSRDSWQCKAQINWYGPRDCIQEVCVGVFLEP